MSHVNRYDWEGVNGMTEACADGEFVLFADHASELAKLKSENDALRKDADRYRWLRDKANASWESWFELSADEADKDVDEWMDQEGK